MSQRTPAKKSKSKKQAEDKLPVLEHSTKSPKSPNISPVINKKRSKSYDLSKSPKTLLSRMDSTLKENI